MTTTFKIDSLRVWIHLDQLRTYDKDDKNNIVESNQYICYFKFAEPTPFVLGELIRDEIGKPILFDSADEAMEKTINIIKKRYSI